MSEIWHIVAGFPTERIIVSLKSRYHPNWVLLWKLWGKAKQTLFHSHSCWQSLVLCGCRTEVSVYFLAINQVLLLAFRCHLHSLPLVTSVFEPSVVHQTILMLQNHWLPLLPPAGCFKGLMWLSQTHLSNFPALIKIDWFETSITCANFFTAVPGSVLII